MIDVDMTPVRDQHGAMRGHENGVNGHPDPQVKRFDQERLVISQFSREDLEDKYLRLYEDSISLRKHMVKQEDKIKKLAAKLLRLANDKKRGGGSARQFEHDDRVLQMEQRVQELDIQNRQLKDKVQIMKQQMGSQGKRHTPYDHVQSRINSGVSKPGTVTRPSRNKDTRVISPLHSGRNLSPTGSMPRYGHSLLEDARAENRRLERVIRQMTEQIHIHKQTMEELKEQVRMKEAEFEEDVLRIKQQASKGQRIAIQENMDLIKLQRDLKEKSTMLTAVHAKYQTLESKMATAEASHAQLIHEMDRLGAELKMKEQQNLKLETDMKQLHSAQRRIVEMEHLAHDLQRDNAILKDANEKLMNNAFDTAREREWREKEQALRTQIAQLESTMKRDVGEKGEVLTRLEQERDSKDLMENELSALRVRHYELQQAHDQLADQMKFFTKVASTRSDGTMESAVEMSEIEDALVIVKQRREKGIQNLDFLTAVDEESNQDLKRHLQEAQAAHADTIQELEKTRSMLVVQYKINNDYKHELDMVTSRTEQIQAEADLKLSEYAKLLDIRASRIRKLQHQLKDVAYGTRQFPATATDRAAEMEADDAESVTDDVALQRGENLVEIHVGKMVLNDHAISILGECDPQIFCTWDFYEFETQATAVMRGTAPDFDLTAQYAVRVDDFFLHYMQKDATTLELYQVVGSDYRTVGACQLSLRPLLDSRRGRVYATAQLLSMVDGESDGGLSLGLVEYWVRLRVPMDQALRLYRERTKALGYLNANDTAAGEALKALDESAAVRPEDNINNLHVKLIRCQGVKARRPDMQPSVYCVYKFFDFPDHDTNVIPSSQAPEFHDHKTFTVHMTPDLDRYLKSQPLDIFMFDDTDPDEASYLGRASVPLIPLVHSKPVAGAFEMIGPDGQPCGSVEVVFLWQFNYMPAHISARTETLEATAAAMAKAHGVRKDAPASVELLPGEEEEMRPLPSSLMPQARPERDVGPQPGISAPVAPGSHAASKSRSPTAKEQRPKAEERQRESPPLVAVHRPGKSILKKSQREPGVAGERFRQLSEQERPKLDDMEVGGETSSGTEAEEAAVVPSAAPDRHVDVRASVDSLGRSQHSDSTLVGDSQTITSVTRDDHSSVRRRHPKASESSSEPSPFPVGTNNRDPIAPPRGGRRSSVSDNGSDSDVVVVAESARSSREGIRDSGGSQSASAPLSPTDTVVIEVVHLQLEDNASLLYDPQVKILYVDYTFLDPNDVVETPMGLPKPPLKDANKKITFNFRKSFAVDFDNHYEQRQCLASMLMDGFRNDINFNVLSEPSDDDDQSGDCIEQGYADLDIRRILKEGRDLENVELPVVLPNDENKVIGHLCVTIKCLAALQAIQEEIQ